MNPTAPILVAGKDFSQNATLSIALEEVQIYLRKFSSSPEFISKMRIAFGGSFATETALKLGEDWGKGDLSDLPAIEVVPSAIVNGANGAYAGDTNRIYLSEKFLAENGDKIEAVTSVILEEIGHSIDRLLNNSDSLGDEGAIFAAVVLGKNFDDRELVHLKAEDDRAKIVIDGEILAVEQNLSDLNDDDQKFGFQAPPL
jgi:hypothetical protein